MDLTFFLPLALFVASHVLIARSGLKPALISRLGERGYLAAYSALSAALMAWIVAALLAAPRVLLWTPPPGARIFAIAATFIAFALLGAGAASPNPWSVAFRRAGYNPARPGVVGFIRHPIIWGFGLWGLAHLPANGDWPSIALFGGAFAFALLGARSVEKRRRRALGDAVATLAPGRGGLDRNAVIGGLIGISLWALTLAAHPYLFGVSPLAGA